MVGVLVSTCSVISVARGGVGTPVTTGASIAVLLAVLACGVTAGLSWFAVVVLLILTDAFFQFQGHAFPDQIPPDQRFFVDLSATLVIPAVVFCIGVAFEWAKSAALQEQVKAEKDRQEAEHMATLAESERLASLGTLAAGIGHEINNPLSYILGNLDILRASLETNDEQREMMDETLSGAEQIRDVVREMMTYVRTDADDTTPSVHVAQALHTATVLSQSQLRQLSDFTTDCAPTPPVPGSAHRLAQVLINLLVNACQACAEAPDRPSRVAVRAFAQDEHVILEVEDNGLGIPPETQSQIFDPFFTTKEPGSGTGLGLSVSARIVRDMNGTISVDSRPGCTVFRLRFPLAPVALSTPPPALRKLTTRLRILVVDDDARAGRAIAAMLATHHAVSPEVGGEAALARLRADPSWDVLITDVHMPGINGPDLMDALKAEAKPLSALPIVFLTGGINDASLQLRVLTSTHPLVAKPVNLAELEDAIVRALDAAADEPRSV